MSSARRECTYPGCSNPHDSRGWCTTHWLRWKKHGDPAIALNKRPVHDRMAERSRTNSATGCIEWQGSRNSNGYGRISIGHVGHLTHRVAYELTHGPIPPGQVVRHACDNRICLNPEHLSVGAPADNIADMVSRERQARGEKNTKHKLTEQDVRAIRAALERGETGVQLAERFKVNRSSINKIRRGDTWSWLT